MKITALGAFLPLSGGTLTGDLTLGGNKLKGTNYALKTIAGGISVRNVGDTSPAVITAAGLYFNSWVEANATNAYIGARPLDTGNLLLKARDTGVGFAEIARLQGAADPYFQLTLPPVITPAAKPGTPVEGHFGYDSVSDTLWYRNAARHKPIPNAVAVASATVQNSNDAAKATTLTTFTKVKEILLSEYLASVRVAHTQNTVDGGGGGVGRARIYKNGAAIGTEHAINGTYTEDFTNFEAGDLIQIYAKVDVVGDTITITNFRLEYDYTLAPAVTTNQDP